MTGDAQPNPTTSDVPTERFVDVKLEEYKTLRSEVLLSLQQGQSVLNFGW